MKNLLYCVALGIALTTAPTVAHHGSDGMVDDEVYSMIDDMVSNTPHATLEFDDDMGGDTTETTVSTRSVRDAENLIDDGLLEYASMLDGDVTLIIEFDDNGGATILINQEE